jgi:hypothetical protein
MLPTNPPTEISDEHKARLVKPGTEEKLLRLHRQVLGRTITVVHPYADRVYVRVLPTSTMGVIPYNSPEVVWADICYKQPGYSCHVRTPQGLRVSNHKTLASALRKARKAVSRHATTKPEPGWTHELHRRVRPLISVYPRLIDVEFSRSYWAWVDSDPLGDMDPYDRYEDELIGPPEDHISHEGQRISFYDPIEPPIQSLQALRHADAGW